MANRQIGLRRLGIFALLLVICAFAKVFRTHAQATWSCSLANVPWVQGTITYANFVCTDGAQAQKFQVPEPSPLPATWYSDEAALLISQITAAPAPPAPGATITPTVATTTPPDPNAAIEAQFNTDYSLLRQYERAIDDGLITNTDPNYLAALSAAQKDFQANESVLIGQVPGK